ncbi:MAG: hypothetical protein ACYCPT_05205 [Acidimicrobiales bacterium]
MTFVLDPSPSVLEVLRSEHRERPTSDSTLAATLRSRLEESIVERLGAAPLVTPITIRASTLRQRDWTQNSATTTLSQARGVLVTQALRLICAGLELSEPFEDTVRAWRLDAGTNALLNEVEQLSNDSRARLIAEVTAHCVTLQRSLGPLSNFWLPRTSLRAYQRLGAGNVVLRDVVDLMVGTTSSVAASIALLDVTTSPLDESAERVLRYHALVQTLRTSIVPLRTSIFSTATSELWSSDVDSTLLHRSVDDVLEVLDTEWVTA